MKIIDMEFNKEYVISTFGNTPEKDKAALFEVGFMEGEVIKKNIDVNSSNGVVLFSIENATFFVNEKYLKFIEVEEIV